MLLNILLILSIVYSKVCADCRQTLTTVSGTHAPREPICSGDLIFEDNFDRLDLQIWKHESTLGGNSGNNQFQWYTNNRCNSYAEDGILHLKPTLVADDVGEAFLYNGTIDLNEEPTDDCTNPLYDGCKRTGTTEIILNPVKSTRMHTINSFAFKYGKVEVNARIPVGDWLWPAIWMMPRWSDYSSWPASGEIDIMESRGNRHFMLDNVNIGVEQTSCALHWGPNSHFDRYKYTFFRKNKPEGWNTKFHKYQFLWTPENVTFSVDDDILGIVVPPEGGFWKLGELDKTDYDNPWKEGGVMAPFDKEFYFIINVAVGSTSFFSDGAKNEPYEKPWKNSRGRASMTDFWKANDLWLPTWNLKSDDSHFQIDYIRAYAL